MRNLTYNVDKWTCYLWKHLLQESAVVRGHVESGKSKVPTFDSFAREVFARLYASPTRCPRARPEDAWATTLHEALDELPAFTKLAAHCARNKDFASAATANILEQIVDKLPEVSAPLTDPEARRKEVHGLLDFLKALAPDDNARREVERAIEEAKRAGKAAIGAMDKVAAAIDKDAVRQALRRSVDAAATDVEEFCAASSGLSGLGGTGRVSEATQSAVASALKESDAMKRLGLLAGRMRRIAMAKRRARTRAQPSELSDVTTGNDLARVLPHEFLKLTDPLLALDFLRAFVEGTLLQYELSGSERQGRGPIVVLIDDSDSMDGPRSIFAKAVALALADLALADQRACRLVRFSHKLNATLDVRPGRDATRDLLGFLAGNVDGGTNFELPLLAAREAIDHDLTLDRADVVLVTDGEAELSSEFLADWRRRAKRDGLTTYAVSIGAEAPPVLRALTPDVIELRSLVPERLEDTLFGPLTN